MAINLDEFWDLAALGGKVQATYDIFKILNDKDKNSAEMTMELLEYQNNVHNEETTWIRFRTRLVCGHMQLGM